MTLSTFAQKLVIWQKQSGRHNLPWQVQDPYHVWLSEIMLQQTQVATVLNYYPRFITAFPNIESLANAKEDDVMALWSGLGYYSRARNLHKAAKQVMSEFQGIFPDTREHLEKLCGIGRSTAAAICAFSFQKREAILDGNVKRVICRVFALDGNPIDKKFEQTLWQKAESLLPESNNMGRYTQGLMDLGATICTRTKPKCLLCPMNDICQAKTQNLIHLLPRKKEKKAVPTKVLYWLIITNKNKQILLVKRPSKGIWGGLYCLPTFEQLNDAQQFLKEHQLDLNDFEQYDEIKHRLTHFLLLITPFLFTSVEDIHLHAPYEWVNEIDLNNKALPTPLVKLLAQQKVF
ncbi:A/G-specific adenine glycosylase [Neisseria sp. Ec49-e6-T10]|uniref:A/G-specific adenine glycosylase n=1 Tax=Neisseria sp. Ec49-e6-T10 TaxID=3140744 RepID=UPI003EBF7729